MLSISMTHSDFRPTQDKCESKSTDVFELESKEIFSENFLAEYNKITNLEDFPLDQWRTF
jgi:hypothetical protein